jgi:hyperosmotically inducible periplasmic protein
MRIKRIFLFVAISIGLYASTKPPMTDNTIGDKVMLKLAQDQVVKGGGLKIDVKDGAVTITGKVESDTQKSRAEKLAKKVPGVKSVDNKIVVTHVP